MENINLIREYFEKFFSGRARISELREYLREDFSFQGPLMAADSRAEYLAQLTQFGDEMELQAGIREIIAQGDAVAALVDYQGPRGPITYAQWFEIRDGKISRLEVVYDPRPFLNQDPKQ